MNERREKREKTEWESPFWGGFYCFLFLLEKRRDARLIVSELVKVCEQIGVKWKIRKHEQ